VTDKPPPTLGYSMALGRGDGAPEPMLLHATTVSIEGRAALILGPSGSGKSSLALALMAFGADLVADDQTFLDRRGDEVWARCPPAIAGMIEARGVGLLKAPTVEAARVALVVDLAQPEPERLPDRRKRDVMGVAIDLVLAAPSSHVTFAILQLLKHGRVP
jgi:HPr kinase/phosphorylase